MDRRKNICLISALLMLLLLAAPTVGLATGTQTRLTIEYCYEETPVPGAQFQIYAVGQVSGEALSLTGRFADYPVKLDDLEASRLQAAAWTLYGFALKDGLAPDRTAQTNELGMAVAEDLPEGVYLITSLPRTVDGITYTTAPQFVILPYGDQDRVALIPKCAIREETGPLTRQVLKQWEDAGNEAARPASVTVHLLKDDRVYDTVTLSKENNWCHTWTQLAPDAQWLVVEDVPQDYTVCVRQEGSTFLVINENDTPPPPVDPPDIPQTGLLWWPVPVLAVLGIVLIVLGCLRSGERRQEDD